MYENTNKKSQQSLTKLVNKFWKDSDWLGEHRNRLTIKERKEFETTYMRFVDLFENPHIRALVSIEHRPLEAKKFSKRAVPKSSRGESPKANHT